MPGNDTYLALYELGVTLILFTEYSFIGIALVARWLHCMVRELSHKLVLAFPSVRPALLWAVRAEAYVHFQFSRGETLTIQAELWSFLAAEKEENDEAELKLAAVFAQLRGIANRVFHPVARSPPVVALAVNSAVAHDSGEGRGAAESGSVAPGPGGAATSSVTATDAAATGTANTNGDAQVFSAERASARHVQSIETMNPLQVASPRIHVEMEEFDELSSDSENIIHL